MSASDALVKAEQLHEISDSVTAMVACILQEQLAPILETIREHSRLLDWHSALLNHSTVMNRYNVGKLDDLRDLQTNVNYKLQFHIDPEDRKRPTYRGPQPTSAPQSTAIATSAGSSSQKDAFPFSEGSPADSSSRGCTDSPVGTSSATNAPDALARQLTPGHWTSCKQLSTTTNSPEGRSRWMWRTNDQAGSTARTCLRRDARSDVELVTRDRPVRTRSCSRAPASIRPAASLRKRGNREPLQDKRGGHACCCAAEQKGCWEETKARR
ncbi:hypothetical protein EDB83DRAFT_32022 [Lactarius deliciosus]|nr:hypothetical protein EDB83DRAFT_32022 [Lactarius deliciosus]